jgi:hypothetical protein
MTPENNYKEIFFEYQKNVFQVENDLKFWQNFLNLSIERFKVDNPENRAIIISIFSVFNINHNKVSYLYANSASPFSIEVKDLNSHCDNFFIWIMNLSIVSVYNSVELLLLQSIHEKYFSMVINPIKGKKEANQVVLEIKKFFIKSSQEHTSKNNRHLIAFLKVKLPAFELFLKENVYDHKSNWEQFYEFFSVLRNVITHQGMLISPNTRNNLNSTAGDLFNCFFEQPQNPKNTEILKAKDVESFLHFVRQVNDFALNSLKFIANQQDFSFINLRK